jgi:pilus assembly protein Flp/PilA
MNWLVMSARNFLREEDGVTAIEYGLLAALIAVAITVGANLLGQNLNTLFSSLADCLTPANLPNACVL